MTDHVKPPFTNLNSFACCALILAYYDYRADVKCLLNKLSKNSGAYYKAHREILSGHLISFPRKQPFFNEIVLKD